MQKLAWTAYNKHSHFYFDQYNSVSFYKIHRSFSKFLPPLGSKILDVGSGSGRDALALAKKGYFVTAVEPSVGMLSLSQRLYPHKRITWVRDSLPLLKELSFNQSTFDFILLSAVWMHIKPEKRKRSLKRLMELLSDKGVIAITLRIGPSLPERLIHQVDVESLISIAESLNLKILYISRSTKDSLSRHEVTWKKVVLSKSF